MAAREDVWLSEVLGYPVFAVDDPGGAPSAGLSYAKIPVAEVARVAEFGQCGFAVVDVNVTLGRDPGPVEGAAASVVPAAPEHHEALLDLAGRCFRYSRFHLDPAIPDELAHRVKREWVRSYVEGTRGVELLAALDDGAPVGFLAVLESDDARAIDLVGVAPEAQGRGFGSALVAEFARRHGPQTGELRVGTQIANVPSLRLYGKLGFSVQTAAYVLHRHA